MRNQFFLYLADSCHTVNSWRQYVFNGNSFEMWQYWDSRDIDVWYWVCWCKLCLQFSFRQFSAKIL